MLHRHQSKLHPLAAALTIAAAAYSSAPTPACAAARPTLTPVEVRGHAGTQGQLDLDVRALTGSHLGLSVRETPASVAVVERAMIETRGAQTTHEMLRAVPGVTTLDAPGNPGLRYRGFAGGSVTQLFNGINLHTPQAARPVDSWIYDHVETLGGPSSFLSGAGGVGGTINYVSKVAEAQNFADGRVRLGTYGLREAALTINQHISGDAPDESKHYGRIDTHYHNGQGWLNGVHRQAKQIAASLLSDFGDGLNHTLAYEYQTEEVRRPYWETPLLNPLAGRARIDKGVRFKNYNSRDGYYGQEVHWLRSLTQWQIDDTLHLSNTAYGYSGKRVYRNVENVRYTPDNRWVIRSNAVQQLHDQRVYGDQIEAVFSNLFLWVPVDLAVGADYSVNKQSFYPDVTPGIISIDDPYDFDAGYFSGNPNMPDLARVHLLERENTLTTAAFYVEGRFQILPEVQLFSALRRDWLRASLNNWREVTPDTPKSTQRTYNPITRRWALLWAVAPGLDAYLQYATAAEPASGALANASFAELRQHSKLTTGRQLEAGAKLDFWGGKGNATVASYYIERENIATQDPDDRLKTVLVGQQSARGVELTVGLQATPKLAVQGNLSLVDARYDDFYQNGVSLAGKTPRNTPAWVANAWVSYAFSSKFNASASVQHVSRVYADAANTLYWPSYTLIDLALNWQVNPTLQITCRVRNATDEIYATDLNPTMAYLGAPRTAEVAIQYRY